MTKTERKQKRALAKLRRHCRTFRGSTQRQLYAENMTNVDALVLIDMGFRSQHEDWWVKRMRERAANGEVTSACHWFDWPKKELLKLVQE